MVAVARFWEARVADGRLADARAWVRDVLAVRAAAHEGFVGAEVFVADASGDQPARVVLLTRWSSAPDDLDEALPADGSIARAHGWFFGEDGPA